MSHAVPLTRYVAVPAHERVLDCLADLLFAADDVLEALKAEDATRLAWIEPHVRSIYEATNDLMKKLSD